LTLYLDTSVLVAALTNEPRTPEILDWIDRQDVGEILISDWLITEVSSALSLKLRTRQLTAEERAAALSEFRRISAVLEVMRVSTPHFRTAATFVEQFELGLRAGDALHLAVAASFGATLCTLDQRLCAAGPPLGVPAQLI
jgi:uncharacterized protein